MSVENLGVAPKGAAHPAAGKPGGETSLFRASKNLRN
jgi:hypothetical protein